MTKKIHILPLREAAFGAGITVPIYLDNKISVASMDAAVAAGQQIILVPQKKWNFPTNANDLFNVGTLADVIQVLRLPDNSIHTIVQTISAVAVSDISVENGIFSGAAEILPFTDDSDMEKTLVLRDRVADEIKGLNLPRRIRTEKLNSLIENYPMPAFVDAVMQLLPMEPEVAVKILGAGSYYDKLVLLLEQIGIMNEIAKIDESIAKRVQQQMEGGHRIAVLNEKLRAIQKELGEDSEEMDTESLKKRIENSAMPKNTKDKAMSEWRRMRAHNAMSTEGAVLKTYLDELLSMPWGTAKNSPIELDAARCALDAQHSGMTDIKERILEHIAVMRKTKNAAGTILCLVGAPGVGKTSLGKSIATALNRPYQRISLGGVSDEAHFRGHRKTYIGSQPGRIMDALKRCGTNNPVIILDEIDKMGRDHRGDPESALLEILDPEQNKTFRDHYLEVDFDLGNVVFIATANSMNFSPALRDRMEIIEIPGYTMDEKIAIAREHLIGRAAVDTGWDANNITIDDNALRHLINNYTAESGVRELTRTITALLRRSLLANGGDDAPTEFTPAKIDELLGTRRNAGAGKKIGFNTNNIRV
ncbi:MAG: AAA family ATPase [Rickettsiales bacterium]|jgi:ATP-dependent Lon protease|nr:AAA family ATPase [Rickettsiales bacterium]